MNPFWKVHRRERRHRLHDRPLEVAWAWLAPVALGALAAPLARPVLLWFLDADGPVFAAGLAGLALRLGLALCGAGILLVHERVVRGPERAILDPHPVDPAALVPVQGLRLLLATAPLCAAAAALLAPLWLAGHGRAFLLALPLLAGGWLSGVSLGFLSQLGAVWGARSRSLAAVLEAFRGNTPPMQAVLIWAPGVALAACAGALFAGMRGLELALRGDPGAPLLLALPAALAVLGWLPVAALARRTWYPATALVAEVDAAWAAVEVPEAARRVYLEWTVRFVPSALRPHLLRSLRAGWRAHRGWVLGAWGLGLPAGLAGLADAPDAPSRALLVAASALALLGGVGVLLETRDPAWVAPALGVRPVHRAQAHALATFGFLQGAVLPPVAAVLLRHGAESLALLGLLEAEALALSAAAAGLGLAGRRAWLGYAPLALACWILTTRSLP